MRKMEGNMENGTSADARSESFSLWKSFFTFLEVTNRVMILLVTGYVLYLAGKKLTVTNVHAGLLTVGYVMLMSEGIFALAGESLLTRKLTRSVVKHIHWMAQCLGAAFSIAGVVIMYQVKETHFNSIHGILGFASVVIMCVLGFSGTHVIYAINLRNIVRPVIAKLCHNFLGISCFVLGMLSQCYGYQKKWMVSAGGQEVANVCTVFTGLIVFFSLIGALRSLRGQIVGTFK